MAAGYDGQRGQEGERAPDELSRVRYMMGSEPFGEGGWLLGVTYNRDGLDADGEDVEGEVPRVRERVLLPELGEQRV